MSIRWSSLCLQAPRVCKFRTERRSWRSLMPQRGDRARYRPCVGPGRSAAAVSTVGTVSPRSIFCREAARMPYLPDLRVLLTAGYRVERDERAYVVQPYDLGPVV